MTYPRGSFKLSAHSHPGSWKRAVALTVGFAVLAGCASIAPGSDPVVVRTEQALKSADVLYGQAMAYFFRPGIAAGMKPSTYDIFEKIRTKYDPAWKALLAAKNAYKAGTRSDVSAELVALADLLNAAIPFLPGDAKPVPREVK